MTIDEMINEIEDILLQEENKYYKPGYFSTDKKIKRKISLTHAIKAFNEARYYNKEMKT